MIETLAETKEWIYFKKLANEKLSTSRLPTSRLPPTPRFPSDLSLAPATAHLSEMVKASSQPAWEPKIGTLHRFHVGVTYWKNTLFRRWKRSWLAGGLEQSMSFRHTFQGALLASFTTPAAGSWQRWVNSCPLSREVCSGVTGSPTFGVQTGRTECVGAGEAHPGKKIASPTQIPSLDTSEQRLLSGR